MKICTNIHCKEENPQPYSNFFIDNNAKDGYCYKCKSCMKKLKQEYDKTYRKRPDIIKREKERLLIKNYGITLEQFNNLLLLQNYKCAICNVEYGTGPRAFAVDHDHISNKVRSLLCGNCNMGLGKFKDSIELLEKAKQYLIIHQST